MSFKRRFTGSNDKEFPETLGNMPDQEPEPCDICPLEDCCSICTVFDKKEAQKQ